MSVDPREFYAVAAQLAVSPGEAEQRTAVGRAYYAALHAAARALRGDYGPFPISGAFHGAVADALAKDAGVRAHDRLVTLRKARRFVDYDIDDIMPPPASRYALHVARQFLSFVKQKYGV